MPTNYNCGDFSNSSKPTSKDKKKILHRKESENYLFSHFLHNLLLDPGQVCLPPPVKVNLSIFLEVNLLLHFPRPGRLCPPGFCLRRSHCSPGGGVEGCPGGADAVRYLETFGSCQHSTFAWRIRSIVTEL